MKNILFFLLCFSCEMVFAKLLNVNSNDIFKYKFYVGGVGGFGSTTWQGLVPSAVNQNNAMSLSTPLMVNEGGGVWGLSAGYELTPYFALEANYMRFPNAKISYDEDSLFAFEQNGLIKFTSRTDTGSVMGKVMLIIPKTSIRIFSGAGVASVFRKDIINTDYRISPTFAAGLNFNINERVMAEIGTNYTAGYGESEINPANDYIPFLYSFFVKVALRFNPT
jgi:hypothetical protein